jgi:tetratricopeptide (TPR) repeat protein
MIPHHVVEVSRSVARAYDSKHACSPALPRVVRQIPKNDILSLDGIPFPKTVAALAREHTAPYSGSLETEVIWAAEYIRLFSDQIDSMLQGQQAFVRAMLLGQYARAQEHLDAIRAQHGISLWWISGAFLVADAIGGLAANRAALQSVLAAKNPFVSPIASFFSQRAEARLSPGNYDAEVTQLCRRHPQTAEYAPALFHFQFETNFHAVPRFGDLAALLHRQSLNAVFDRYRTLVRCLQVLASTDTQGARALLSTTLPSLAPVTRDPRLEILASVATPSSPIRRTSLNRALYSILDGYTRGLYDKVLAEASTLLAAHPDVFELYELAAKAALYSDSAPPIPFPESSLAALLLRAVHDVLEKNERTAAAVALLRKTAYQLDGSHFADHVFGFVLEHDPGPSPLRPSAFAALNSSCVTPRLAQLFNAPDALALLRQLGRSSRHNEAVRLFSALHEGADLEPLALPPHRKLKYRGHALLRQRNFGTAAAVFEELRELSPTPLVELAAVAGLFEAYADADRLSDCAHMLVDAYLTRPHLLSGLPLDRLFSPLAPPPPDVAKDISWPILHSIYLAHRAVDRRAERLYASYEAFLSAHGCDRPSSLGAHRDQFDRARFIFFLRHVCVPEVMDFSVAFASSEELRGERIQICQLLLALDPPHTDAYSQEIARLTQEGQIQRALRHLDQRKIFIDTAGILRSLDRGFRERFERFLEYSQLGQPLRETVGLSGSLDSGNTVLLISDAAIEQLTELFEELLNRFISSNEYGLDSYLSVRIRHGTLSGQLRGPFEREHLITRKSGSAGEYERNRFWGERILGLYGTETQRKCDAAFAAFSSAVDSLIDRARSEWLQIRGPANDNKGLFDFTYAGTQLGEVFARLFTVRSFEAFVQTVFTELWDRTRRNLEDVRTKFRQDLLGELTAALDNLLASLTAAAPDIPHTELAEAARRCRTAIQTEIETIVEWFRSADEQGLADFDPGLLLETASEVIRNCFPLCPFHLESNFDESIRFLGHTFAPFSDLLFILLENAVRHSGLPSVAPVARIERVAETVVITISSSFASSVDTATLLEVATVLSGLKDRGASKIVRSEGGSGHHKLHKIIRHDLARHSDYDVQVSVADRAFTVRITMRTAGVAV